MNVIIEIQRSNITLAQFLAMVRYECKKKGTECNIERDEFENPSMEHNTRYYIKEDKKISYDDNYKTECDAKDAFAQAEIYIVKPLKFQSYVLNHDGSVYNEICEFTFWDDKKGNGYYYQINKD